MTKTLISFLISCACLLPVAAHAQVNYVLNGGFEQYDTCPYDWNQIQLAKYWHTLDTVDYFPACAPEFCHICAGSNIYVGIPTTFSYNHEPRSGGGIVQNCFYFDEGYSSLYYRDYTQGHLRTDLTNGTSYCVTFYVTLAQSSQYATNKMGAYLDDGSIDIGADTGTCDNMITWVTPQVYTNIIVNDTINWVKIQGNFIANGTERFITIGNFFPTASTDTIRLDPWTENNFTWYLIDDVSVIESDAVADAGPNILIGNGDTVHIGTYEDGMPCTWYQLGSSAPIGYGGGIKVQPASTTSYVVELDLCGNVTRDTMTVYVVPAGVANSTRGQIVTYPTPATNQWHVDHAANCDLVITDLAGRSVFSNTLHSEQETINISHLNSGTYIVAITANNGVRHTTRLLIEK